MCVRIKLLNFKKLWTARVLSAFLPNHNIDLPPKLLNAWCPFFPRSKLILSVQAFPSFIGRVVVDKVAIDVQVCFSKWQISGHQSLLVMWDCLLSSPSSSKEVAIEDAVYELSSKVCSVIKYLRKWQKWEC